MIGVQSGLNWPRTGISDGALFNAVMNLLFPYKAVNCLTRRITISLPRILMHVVRQLVSYIVSCRLKHFFVISAYGLKRSWPS
jgi:hypothetical protein